MNDPVLPDRGNEIDLSGTASLMISQEPFEPIIITIKPMLFSGGYYYPSGGWDDFHGFFDTVEGAKEYLEKQYPFPYGRWAHIVENGEKMIWQACGSLNHESNWIWNKCD